MLNNKNKNKSLKMTEKKEQKKKTKKPTKDQQIEDLTDLLKRTQAEFVNYRARVEKEAQKLLQYSCSGMVKKLLPVLDSFELAIKNSKETEHKKGVELVYAQLAGILQNEGLTIIEAKGKKYDPYKHEVLLKEKSSKESGTVLEELQKGYMLKEKVLRHSKVKVAE